MQQAKYPNLENIQYSESSSKNQDLQQQLVKNTNDNITFVPVLISPQENIQAQQSYQQYAQYQQHQVAPFYQNQNHYIVPFQNPESSNLLQDQEFSKQKLFLCGILGLYILWSILFVCLLFPISYVFVGTQNGSKNPFPFILFILFSFTTIFLAKLGVAKNYRNSMISILLLSGVVLSYTCFYSSFLASMAAMSTQQFGWDFLIGLLVATSVIGNFIFNFILLICLMFAETKLKMIYPILLELFVIFIFSIATHPVFLLCIFFMLPYSICLVNAFKQIIKGRFQLEKNQLQLNNLFILYLPGRWLHFIVRLFVVQIDISLMYLFYLLFVIIINFQQNYKRCQEPFIIILIIFFSSSQMILLYRKLESYFLFLQMRFLINLVILFC